MESYKSNPLIRGLIQLIPSRFSTAIDAALLAKLETIRKERMRIFFDELARGDIVIDESLLESEDFLHCFFSTTKYALNSRRRQKIKIFARLLRESCIGDTFKNIDEYEDFLNILDDLSYREIQILIILDEFYEKNKDQKQEHNGNDSSWVSTFWGEFQEKIHSQMGIDNSELGDHMNRLVRSGCYKIFHEYWGADGVKGKLTPTYKKLRKYILCSDF